MKKLFISDQDIRNIIREAVQNILTDNNNPSIEQIEELVGYRFYEDDPLSFIEDFEHCFMDVVENQTIKQRGETPFIKSDYDNLTVEQLEPYIPFLRKQCEQSLQKLFLEYKQKMEQSYKLLDNCVRALQQYKQRN